MRAHLIELRPTPEQETYFAQCAGTMRFVYNALVARHRSMVPYDKKEYQKFAVNLRQTTPWMREVTARATYEAVDQFHDAMLLFFNSRSGRITGIKYSIPVFKKRGKCREAFRFTFHRQFKINGRKLRIQSLKSEISMREKLRFNEPAKTVNISKRGGKWFASFLVETGSTVRPLKEAMRKPSVGVDLGLKHFAALSTGEFIANPRFHRKSEKLLRRRQRQVDKKVKGSNRRAVAAKRVARLYKKISDKKQAFHHKVTNTLVDTYKKITIETLGIRGMVRTRHLGKSIADAGWGTFVRILTYKCEANGVELIRVPQNFPSSKTCSCCGNIKEDLRWWNRIYRCASCGFTEDRDVNAAKNLEKYIPSPPIIGRRETDTEEIGKTSREAVSSDCVNNEKTTNWRTSPKATF